MSYHSRSKNESGLCAGVCAKCGLEKPQRKKYCKKCFNKIKLEKKLG